MIEVNNLIKNYGPVQAVKGVSFTAEKGHIYGFLGPNGAGKSTTMNMITGCLAPTDGEIKVNGFDIYEDAVEAKKFIGYLPEIPPLYNDMTPLEFLEFVGGVKGLRRKALYDAIEEAMEKTGISAVSGRLIKNLSKGYKQRVGIAQAILGNPEIIILDEPTVGLDPIQIVEVRNLIKSLKEEHIVILSSHILQEISAVCDYVIMISRGTVVASDTMENLLSENSEKSVIKIETTAEEEIFRSALADIEEITDISVEKTGAHNTFEVDAPVGVDVSGEVLRALAAMEIGIISMTNNESTLEDVFIRLAGESLDAGAAYAMEQEEKKAMKAARKIRITDEERGNAYYKEVYDEEDGEAGDDYKPLFEDTAVEEITEEDTAEEETTEETVDEEITEKETVEKETEEKNENKEDDE